MSYNVNSIYILKDLVICLIVIVWELKILAAVVLREMEFRFIFCVWDTKFMIRKDGLIKDLFTTCRIRLSFPQSNPSGAKKQ